MIDQAWNYKKTLKSLKKWLDNVNVRRSCFEEPLGELELYGSGAPLTGIWTRPVSNLDDIANWKKTAGCVALCQGEQRKGASELFAAFRYASWGLQLLLAYHLASPERKRIVLLDGACLWLAVAMMVGSKEDASGLGRRVVAGLEGGVTNSGDSRVSRFILKLLGTWTGMELSAEALRRVPAAAAEYENLLAHLDDAQVPEHLVHEACDFHTSRSHELTDDENYEFSEQVYWILPVEILAWMRVRADRGLALPAIHHPLMETPLAALPPPLGPTSDPVLDAVVARFRRDFSHLKL